MKCFIGIYVEAAGELCRFEWPPCRVLSSYLGGIQQALCRGLIGKPASFQRVAFSRQCPIVGGGGFSHINELDKNRRRLLQCRLTLMVSG